MPNNSSDIRLGRFLVSETGEISLKAGAHIDDNIDELAELVAKVRDGYQKGDDLLPVIGVGPKLSNPDELVRFKGLNPPPGGVFDEIFGAAVNEANTSIFSSVKGFVDRYMIEATAGGGF